MAETYDPDKAHEYYIRTRELKGRQPGAQEPTGGSRAPAKAEPANDRQKARAAAAERVKALNGKLSQLREALAAARAKASPSEASKDKPDTASEKSKDDKYNEKYYTEHKNEIKNDRKADSRSAPSKSGSSSSASESGTRSVAEIESAIKTTLVQLKAAIAKLKTL